MQVYWLNNLATFTFQLRKTIINGPMQNLKCGKNTGMM